MAGDKTSPRSRWKKKITLYAKRSFVPAAASFTPLKSSVKCAPTEEGLRREPKSCSYRCRDRFCTDKRVFSVESTASDCIRFRFGGWRSRTQSIMLPAAVASTVFVTMYFADLQGIRVDGIKPKTCDKRRGRQRRKKNTNVHLYYVPVQWYRFKKNIHII